ncbi:hypothetical protein [Flavihumibacter petaseus]|nr:hypothetical protein [Flavihumibacter petaseus]
MKQHASAIATALLLVGGLAVAEVFAQKDFAAINARKFKTVDPALLAMNNPASATAVEKSPVGNSVYTLNSKMAKKFSRNFPKAVNATWYQDGKLTRFFFQENGVITRTTLDKSGDVLNTIRYYGAEKLPSSVISQVKDAYKGYHMEQVTEISTVDGKAYIINMKGIDDWLQLRYVDGEMSEYGKFTY